MIYVPVQWVKMCFCWINNAVYIESSVHYRSGNSAGTGHAIQFEQA